MADVRSSCLVVAFALAGPSTVAAQREARLERRREAEKANPDVGP